MHSILVINIQLTKVDPILLKVVITLFPSSLSFEIGLDLSCIILYLIPSPKSFSN